MTTLSSLVASSQATSPAPLSPAAAACLEALLARELRGLEAAAQRLGAAGLQTARGASDGDALRLACSFQQLLQPPLRHHCEYHATLVNSRPAQWPVSGEVCVPVAAALVLGVGGGGGGGGGSGLAMPGLARAPAGRAAAVDDAGGAGGAAGAADFSSLHAGAKRARVQHGPPPGFDDE